MFCYILFAKRLLGTLDNTGIGDNIRHIESYLTDNRKTKMKPKPNEVMLL